MMSEIVKHEYNSHLIPQRVEDDYVDVTALCQSEGKELAAYLRLQKTKKYLDYLTSDLQIDMSELVQIDKGDGGHTFAHPEVAMDVSVWVSIPCRVWANRTLVHIVRHAKEQAQKLLEEGSSNLLTLPSAPISEIVDDSKALGDLFGPAYGESFAIINIKKFHPHKALPEVPAKERSSLKSSERLLTPTEIAEELGIKCKTTPSPDPKAVNRLLQDLGYQEKVGKKSPWSATEKGKPFTDRKPVSTNSKSDKDQMFWYASILDVLRHALSEGVAAYA